MDRPKRMKSHEYTGPEVWSAFGCSDRDLQGPQKEFARQCRNPLRRAVLLSRRASAEAVPPAIRAALSPAAYRSRRLQLTGNTSPA